MARCDLDRPSVVALHQNLDDASYHQRAAIFHPGLRRLGIEVRDAVYSPAELLGSTEDVVWLRRVGLDGDTARQAARLGKRLVYDFDDAMLFVPNDVLPDDAPPWSFINAGLDAAFTESVRAARVIVAGSRFLAGHARIRGAQRVVVIPTGLETERYPVRRHEAGARVRLVWIGSGPTSGFLFRRHALFRRAAERWPHLTLRVICDRWPAWDDVAVERVSWSRAREAELLAECDIGVSPLPDTPYTRGKCGYKVVQYLAAGLPVVASPVGCHEAVLGDAGFLAAGDDAWLSALAPLVEDAARRAELGARARARATQLFDVQVLLPMLADALRAAAAP